MTRLETLDFERNELAGPIPPELGRLASLKRLILGANDLTRGIPPELGALASLEILRLRRNSFTGPVPPELSTWTRSAIAREANVPPGFNPVHAAAGSPAANRVRLRGGM